MVEQLFNKELAYWRKKNIELFGIELVDDSMPFEALQSSLKDSCDKYWNVDEPCIIAQKLNDGTIDRDYEKKDEKSYRLDLNFYNMCVDVYAKYKGKEYKVCALPTPSVKLSWIINRAHYTPRVTAKRDFNSMVVKVSYDKVYGEYWSYDITKDKFECMNAKYSFEPTIEEIFYNRLSKRSIALLEACVDGLTLDNFKQALRKLPVFEKNSLYNYTFSRVDYFEKLIIDGYKYAKPTKGIILGVNQLFTSTCKNILKTGEVLDDSCLVRSDSTIFSLEQFRTVVNIYNGSFKPAFSYTDTAGFFDSFKTTTSGSAGRQRLLLDNIVIKHGMLYVQDGDVEKDMFKFMYEKQENRLSSLSIAPFCNNDKPKRIMMNTKLTAQAVPLKDEICALTHRILARVGFADLEGYTFADSIVISESFAERLRTYSSDVIYLEHDDHRMYNIEKGIINKPLLYGLYQKTNRAILDRYENIKIDKVDYTNDGVRVFISWEVPFGVGDKITNLHGAKGTVGVILPDHKMPCLLKQAGQMKPGPLEVIISGFSTIRRGSLGQIFEAWALASGIEIENDFASNAIAQYNKQMKEFSNNSVVLFEGKKTIIPLGINKIMRVYHHANIHVSQSHYKSIKTLKLGEMEKLNLIHSDSFSILKELSLRSKNKYANTKSMVEYLERKGLIPEDTTRSLKFCQLLKTLGYELYLDDEPLFRYNVDCEKELNNSVFSEVNNEETFD